MLLQAWTYVNTMSKSIFTSTKPLLKSWIKGHMGLQQTYCCCSRTLLYSMALRKHLQLGSPVWAWPLHIWQLQVSYYPSGNSTIKYAKERVCFYYDRITASMVGTSCHQLWEYTNQPILKTYGNIFRVDSLVKSRDHQKHQAPAQQCKRKMAAGAQAPVSLFPTSRSEPCMVLIDQAAWKAHHWVQPCNLL